MFGHVGGANASSSLAVKYLNNRVIVVRCGRDDVVNVRAMLTFVTELDTQPCLFQVLTISGSVRTCRTAVRNIQHPWHQMDSTIKQQDLALIDAIEH
jgi:RNase P/RNase MRP subunit POP5